MACEAKDPESKTGARTPCTARRRRARQAYDEVVKWLENWTFLDALDRIGKLAILIGVVAWLLSIPSLLEARRNQRKAKIFQAWQVINMAQGKAGSGGRSQALDDLVSEGQPLIGIDLSGGAVLRGLKLPGQDLSHANLSEADLEGANLSGAKLEEANLSAVKLKHANLSEAKLGNARLSGASLQGANLFGASMRGADLSETRLLGANLSGARLGSPGRPVLGWQRIRSLDLAKLWGIRGAPDGFVTWAIREKGAVCVEDQATWRNMLWSVFVENERRPYEKWRNEWEDKHRAATRPGSGREGMVAPAEGQREAMPP